MFKGIPLDLTNYDTYMYLSPTEFSVRDVRYGQIYFAYTINQQYRPKKRGKREV